MAIKLNPETGAYDDTAIDIDPECMRYFCENYGKKIMEPQQKSASG